MNLLDFYRLLAYTICMENTSPKIKFVSRIPDLMRERHIKQVDIMRVAGLSTFTAARLARGDLNVSVTTLMRLVDLFKVDDIGDFAVAVPYEPPAIVAELDLTTQAGSPPRVDGLELVP